MTLPQTTSRPPENAVQRALVAILRADAALTAKIAKIKDVTPPTPAVVDKVPEGQLYPYVRVGDHLSIPDNTLTSFGRQVTTTLHIWTKTGSMGPGQDIADIIVGLLDHRTATMTAALASSGHYCVRIEYEFSQALDDPDPALRHHVVRFRVITGQLT